ncbi:hypothetical protein CKO40_10065 [Halochromatium glycolicum]|uniref:4Fe-4S ferredoxin-type domain-containing protein n=1 Tax=Halochromatium glycolicum TaxID=85075 RepID=A0AAJ0U424_9GAMM|nr:(Fe-S)-binding protein [Halochromatium glycolicum]MBK1704874.1 hypothetical protein [Halochromatium glycolicum]
MPDRTEDRPQQAENQASGDRAKQLLQLADQCVKCGYCLPHCPTFRLTQDEGESPRGRIALIQGWLGGELSFGPRLEAHLDQCLECRACEPVCPSLVHYGELMDGARAERERRRPGWHRWLRRARLGLLARPGALRLTAAVGIVYRWLHLPRPLIQSIAARWPLIAVLDPLARSLRWPRRRPRTALDPSEPQLSKPRPLEHQHPGRSAGRQLDLSQGQSASAQPMHAGRSRVTDHPAIISRVSGDPRRQRREANDGQSQGTDRSDEVDRADRMPALFRGCVARSAQQPSEDAALRVLSRLGYPPAVPSGQTCCGAIHRHNGHPEAAEQLLAQNRALFSERPLVGVASACVAELREHGQLDAIEICRFLLAIPWPEDARLAPLPEAVAVHEPCSHRNLLRDQGAVYELLERIPALELTPLPGNDQCCGAAGTYLTEHPETALVLAEPKIDALKAMRPAYLVTTNTGCALHLAARIRDAGLAIEILHPVELIERQLRIES